MSQQELSKIAFIHVPKTGGKTFRLLLAEKFPIKNIVGGHNRFDMFEHLPKVTWVRDPVERVISHYYFWYRYWINHPKKISKRQAPKRIPPKSIMRFFKHTRPDVKNNKALERYMVDSPTDCSLRKFAELFPNTITTYLGADLSIYRFIGITEHYKDSLKLFDVSFGFGLHTIYDTGKEWHENRNIHKPSISKKDREYIAEFNKLDRELYEEALVKHKEDMATRL
jgi:hypothetical protein